MKRKSLSVILSLALILSLLPGVTLTARAVAEFDGGDGSAGNPYLISTAEQLQEFAARVNGGETALYATLTRDIDLSGICGDGIGNWSPIGNSDKQFTGTFDGGGHTISGLYISAPESDYQGLFGLMVGGTVQNLGVDGSVTGKNYVGGVVGSNFTQGQGTIAMVTGCYNTGDVSGGGSYAGGVVGYSYHLATNCYYLETCAADGTTFINSVGISKTAGAFTTGEVAWLLQNGQEDKTEQVWGQTVGTGTPLLKSSEAGKAAPGCIRSLLRARV